MSRFNFHGFLLTFTALVAFALMPTSAFAQHGGGGGGHAGGGGGGGGFHGGGGGFGGGGYHGGGSYGGGFHGGGYGGSEGRGFESRGYSGGSSGYGRGGYGGGMNRGASASEYHSNYSRAVNDGQWHSFNGGGASSHSTMASGSASHSAANNSHSAIAGSSAGSAHSNMIASNHAIADGGWHSFGTTRAGFVGGGFHSGYGYGYRGYYGWGRGCCWGWGGWGWGWGFGWGWGWGWPYWGFYWGPGWGYWNAWWWNPYWYAPYGYYPYYYYGPYDYGYDDDVQPPYRPRDNQNAPGNAPSNPGTQHQSPTNNASPSADMNETSTSFAPAFGADDPLGPDASLSGATAVQVPFAPEATSSNDASGNALTAEGVTAGGN